MYLKFITLLLALPTFVFAQQADIPAGWSDGYAYANGIRIHYYRATPQPGKPVMVMVHGVTDIGLSWTTLSLNLQGDYDIYMLDARGHGLTDPFTPTDDEEALVKDVVDFVEVMAFKDPILVGHSMGAATVMRLGAMFPDVAQAIVMLDPMLRRRSDRSNVAATRSSADRKPESPSDESPAKKISVNMFGTPETLVVQNNYSFEDLIALGRRQFPLWDDIDINYWALSKKQYHGPYTSEAAQAMRGTMNIGNSLAEIAVPALVLMADASSEVRAANEAAAAVMKNGMLVHIDGAGHNLHHDKLDHTTEVLKKFLSTL